MAIVKDKNVVQSCSDLDVNADFFLSFMETCLLESAASSTAPAALCNNSVIIFLSFHKIGAFFTY